MIISTLNFTDTVTINYRGQTFSFHENHPLLKNERPF
jgi:hypothetical protein